MLRTTSVASLPPLQTGRAAWRGSELMENRGAQRSDSRRSLSGAWGAEPPISTKRDWILTLDAAQVAEIEEAARPLAKQGNEVTRVLPHLAPATFPLPTLGPLLASLLEELLHGRGFALVRGLPIDRYTRLEAATMFMGLGAHLGNARSQNARGHVLGHVCDLGLSGADPNVRIYQTSERQTFHTDSCDVVGLLCLREAKRGGDSLLVSALTIFNELRATRPDLLARLLLPMPHDRRGEIPAGMKPYFEIPVFSDYMGELTVFYQRQYFDSAQRFPDARRLDADDVAALDLFDATANDERLTLKMRLEPGDMQFVHNHTMLHDRTGFEDWPETDKKRHLLRLWLACPGARPLPPAFAARYGSLEIGNRGGIVTPTTEMVVPLTPAG